MAIVAPSILASNWGNLTDEVEKAEAAGADWFHLDVMDGQFVPPITFGPQLVKAVKNATSIPIDVHLMIENPENQIKAFADAGADFITVHCEATKHAHRLVQSIQELGVKAGVAVNPGTPLNVVEPVIGSVDLVLIMTVNPGWGGQSFIESSPRKIREAAELIKASGRNIYLEVDGGINKDTAVAAKEAGANVLVAGTFVFGSDDYQESISLLK